MGDPGDRRRTEPRTQASLLGVGLEVGASLSFAAGPSGAHSSSTAVGGRGWGQQVKAGPAHFSQEALGCTTPTSAGPTDLPA